MIRGTEHIAHGYIDGRAIFGSSGGGNLDSILWYYDRPHVQGSILDYIIAFDDPEVWRQVMDRLPHNP